MTVKRRRVERVGLWVPVRVSGHDAAYSKPWEESSRSLDASKHCVAFVLKHPLQIGQVVHLTLPLPRQFRSHDLTAETYKIACPMVCSSSYPMGNSPPMSVPPAMDRLRQPFVLRASSGAFSSLLDFGTAGQTGGREQREADDEESA